MASQPNPGWFLWTGDDEILVYNRADAYRLTHIDQRPQASLHLNHNSDGNDVVVLSGIAERIANVPPADHSPDYMAKYGERMISASGSTEAFAARYSVPLRVRVTRVRGF